MKSASSAETNPSPKPKSNTILKSCERPTANADAFHSFFIYEFDMLLLVLVCDWKLNKKSSSDAGICFKPDLPAMGIGYCLVNHI